jgi:hypothetical protein
MIKLIDIIEEGALVLTPEERQQVEAMLPVIIDNIKKPLLPNDKAYDIGNIKYKFADGEDGEAKVVVGFIEGNAKGQFRTHDPKNRTDNWIVINQVYFSQFFPSSNSFSDFDQRLSRTVTGNENTGIERLRQTLKHEVIHAKDPALNHYYLKEPYSDKDEAVYYKSWAEFQTMTGQFFESLISGTDRVLNSSDNPGDIKRIEKALSNILQYFAGKTKNISLETKEFIDGTGSRNFFQKIFNFLHQIVRMPSDSDYALSEYIAYLTKIKQYNPEGYKEFLKDLYKTIKSIEEKVNNTSTTKIKVQEIKKFSNNNPYHLTSIYKNIINEINNNAIPQTTILLENNLISNIQSNYYFTIEERQAIALYLEHYDKFTEENINDFSSGLLNEGLKDWIGSAWNKIKNVFGNIKDFVAKIWKSIKDFVIEQSKKAYNWAKGKLNKYVPKIKEQIIAIKDKAQLAVEATHINKIYDFLKPYIVTMFDNLGKKAEEKAITEIKEVVMNSTFTRLLVEETESIPTDITKPETISWLKKIGVAIGPLLETLALIFNPIKFALVKIFKELGPQALNKLSEFVAKLGGPSPIKYVILPAIFVELLELAGLFHGADDLIKVALNLVPGIGSALDIIMEVGHFIFIALACYEILHEILHGITTDTTGKAIA